MRKIGSKVNRWFVLLVSLCSILGCQLITSADTPVPCFTYFLENHAKCSKKDNYIVLWGGSSAAQAPGKTLRIVSTFYKKQNGSWKYVDSASKEVFNNGSPTTLSLEVPYNSYSNGTYKSVSSFFVELTENNVTTVYESLLNADSAEVVVNCW